MIHKKKTPLFLFLIPAGVFMAVYLFYPFVMNIVNSFRQIEGLGRPATGTQDPWYGNYLRMFQDAKMMTAFGNTMLLMACTIVFQVGIALVLALLVDRIRAGVQLFRTVYFFPIIISATALGLLFNLIFNYNRGMVNQILDAFVSALPQAPPDGETLGFFGRIGLAVREWFYTTWPDFPKINWHDEPLWRFTMFSPVMWQYVGFYFVIIMTGLNNISGDLYEAAAIDGASNRQSVWRIKLPLLHNTLCTCLTLAITGALKVFDLPITMMPNGIPMDKSWLTGTYMYKVTMEFQDVDYGSTIALFIVVLGVVISQLANVIFKEKDY